MRLQRRQPTRLPRPWDSPGKNTGVGCHFLLQWMKVKSESEVAQLCPTLCDPMDCSPPSSSIHGIFQARVLEWGAIAFSGQWRNMWQTWRKYERYAWQHSHFWPTLPIFSVAGFFRSRVWKANELVSVVKKQKIKGVWPMSLTSSQASWWESKKEEKQMEESRADASYLKVIQ